MVIGESKVKICLCLPLVVLLIFLQQYIILWSLKPTQIDPDLTIFSGLLHKIKSIIQEQFPVTFENVLCELKSDTETIILGDFNICMKNNNNSLDISFTNIMQLFGF
jgi:hypothetical protein